MSASVRLCQSSLAAYPIRPGSLITWLRPSEISPRTRPSSSKTVPAVPCMKLANDLAGVRAKAASAVTRPPPSATAASSSRSMTPSPHCRMLQFSRWPCYDMTIDYSLIISIQKPDKINAFAINLESLWNIRFRVSLFNIFRQCIVIFKNIDPSVY